MKAEEQREKEPPLMPSKLIDQTIRAAIQEFGRSGYSGASTKAIAATAKITEGSLFRLFGSKEKLFEDALRKCVQECFSTGRLAEALHADGESIEDFARAIKRGLRAAMARETPEAIRLVTFALLERPELARAVYTTEFNLANGCLAEMILHFQQRGAIRKDIDADAVSQMLLLSLARHAFMVTARPPNPRPLGSLTRPRASLAEEMPWIMDIYVDVWIRGIACPKATPAKPKARSRSK